MLYEILNSSSYKIAKKRNQTEELDIILSSVTIQKEDYIKLIELAVSGSSLKIR
jgi:hypothetical protein